MMSFLRTGLVAAALLGIFLIPGAGCTVTPDGGGTVVVGGGCTSDAECEAGDACDDTGVCVVDAYAPGSEDAGAECFEDADCSSDNCDDLTDLCGGRVICRTLSEVEAFSRFIEAHFEIDPEKSAARGHVDVGWQSRAARADRL